MFDISVMAADAQVKNSLPVRLFYRAGNTVAATAYDSS